MAATAPGPVLLSIVIVTWNCRDLAVACLRAVLASVIGAGTEIIVVDNASADQTAEAVASLFPEVTLLRNPQNSGFAAANNLAFAQARGQFWLLLNPDAFVALPSGIGDLLAYIVAHPEIGAAGPMLLHADGRHQVGDAGFAPTLGSVTVHALGLGRVLPRLRGVFLPRRSAALEVDWLCGACLMVRAAAAQQAGLMDTQFFLYGEDMEWGCRLRDFGWRVAYLPSIKAVHLQGGTQGASPASTRWLAGLLQLYGKRNARWSLLGARLVLTLGFGGRAAAYGLASVIPGGGRLRQRARAMAACARFGLSFRA